MFFCTFCVEFLHFCHIFCYILPVCSPNSWMTTCLCLVKLPLAGASVVPGSRLHHISTLLLPAPTNPKNLQNNNPPASFCDISGWLDIRLHTLKSHCLLSSCELAWERVLGLLLFWTIFGVHCPPCAWSKILQGLRKWATVFLRLLWNDRDC